MTERVVVPIVRKRETVRSAVDKCVSFACGCAVGEAEGHKLTDPPCTVASIPNFVDTITDCLEQKRYRVVLPSNAVKGSDTKSEAIEKITKIVIQETL